MTAALVRYEAARTALAEAHRVDEVKDIRDKAEAMAAYARQAKDQELILYATEIKVRAERRCGELLRDSAQRGERVTHRDARWGDSESQDATRKPTLADIGVTKDQSARWQSLASMTPEHFETAVATAKETAGQVTTAFMLREAQKTKPAKGRPMEGKKAEELRERLKAVQQESELMTCARRLLALLREQDSVTGPEAELLAEVADAIAACAA